MANSQSVVPKVVVLVLANAGLVLFAVGIRNQSPPMIVGGLIACTVFTNTWAWMRRSELRASTPATGANTVDDGSPPDMLAWSPTFLPESMWIYRWRVSNDRLIAEKRFTGRWEMAFSDIRSIQPRWIPWRRMALVESRSGARILVPRDFAFGPGGLDERLKRQQSPPGVAS